MPQDPLSREVSDLIRGRNANEKRTKKELLFDSSSDDEPVSTNDAPEQDLSKMTEVEREAFIFEREQAKQAKRERLELEKRIKKMEKQESDAATSAKLSAYQQKLRKMENLRDSRKKRRESEDSDYSESEEEIDSHSVILDKKPSVISLEKVLSIQAKRDDIERGIFRSSFPSIITGCFVRVNVGGSRVESSVYRMCQVSSIVSGQSSYNIGKSLTNLRTVLSIGQSRRETTMDIISNGPITPEEFEFWKKNSGEQGVQLLTDKFVSRKHQELTKFFNSPVDEAEMKKIIEKKKSTGNLNVNIAAEKARIMIDIDEAKSQGDLDRIKKLEEKLKTFDSEKQELVKSINTYPARKLFTGSENSTSRSAGELDPFMRRKCKPLDMHFTLSTSDLNNVSTSSTQSLDNSESAVVGSETSRSKADGIAFVHSNLELDLDI